MPRIWHAELRATAIGCVILAMLLTLRCNAKGFSLLPGPRGRQQRISASTAPFTPTAAPFVAMPSTTISLSSEWRFAIDADASGQTRAWAAPDFDDSTWLTVTVPHTWNVMPAYRNYEGIAWYRRHFTLPTSARHAHMRLCFEAVFYRARVWLNGVYLGEHEGGYTPFAFDISGLAPSGVENVLAVQVDNRRAMDRLPATLKPGWSFDWWNYGGIVRNVSLSLSSRAFIAQQKVVAVPHLVAVDKAETATVTTTVTLMNASTDALQGLLSGEVRDADSGRSVPSSSPRVAIRLSPGQHLEVRLTAILFKPQLWHFDHPYLYRWVTSLRAVDGQVWHTAVVTFGVRSVELREARLYLNGEAVRLVGVTRHADSPDHGLAETIIVMASDYADLKTLNVVLSRPAHYPQSEFILDYADRHGILLIPEIPAWQLTAAQMANPRIRELAEQQLREMITAQFNHPSIWAWSVANEIASDTASGHEFIRTMRAFVKALDPTRPVGFASNHLGSQPGADATALTDFVLMNQYFGTWAGPKNGLEQALDAIHAQWPDKTVIISEFGFEPHWERIDGPPAPDPSQYYVIPPNAPSDSEVADMQRRRLITEQLAVLRRKPFVAGAIFWTYQDYRTPSGFTMGVVDATRHRRRSWRILREAYAPARIESVSFPPVVGATQNARVVLHTRGPIELDMPAYTLRKYRLHWVVEAQAGDRILAQGTVQLPTLRPGTTWSGVLTWKGSETAYRLTLSIIRPTGFEVIHRSYESQGHVLQQHDSQ